MLRNITSLVVFIIILFSFEFYVYKIVKGFYANKKNKYRLTVKSFYFGLLIASTLATIIIVIWGNGMSIWVRNFVVAPVFINLITKIFFIIPNILDDVRRLFVYLISFFWQKKATSETGSNKISRSDFMIKTGVALASVPFVSLPFGMVYGPYNYKLHSHKIKFSNLPLSFNSLKIAQLSDIHVGSFYNKEAVMRGVQMLLDQKPDVVFFTGDIVNSRATEMNDYFDVFSKVTAPMGVYSILGNHDYGDYQRWASEEESKANFKAVKEIHKKLGWRLLLDEHIYLEKENDKIAVIGVENWGKGFHQIGDLKKAHANCEAPLKILLSHDPSHWEEEVKKDYKDIDLTLSGHTHGAQIGIETHGFKWSPIQLRYDKWAGLYSENNQYIHINRGFGFLGYPGRIGIWPEVTIIELETT
jgi:predicted MPP superfamily phosphohydrolase